MKLISFFLISFLCAAPSGLAGAQDAATEESLNQLSGKIENLIAGLEAQKKRISELARELESVREQAGRPNASYASQEDLKRLAEKLQEIDRNREKDKELILKEIGKLGKAVAAPQPPAKRPQGSSPPDNPGPTSPKKAAEEKGFDYVIQPRDTLSVIAQAVSKEKNYKLTVDQILKANPNLKPELLRPGQKIFIPGPQ